jgi:hypothetical protein
VTPHRAPDGGLLTAVIGVLAAGEIPVVVQLGEIDRASGI